MASVPVVLAVTFDFYNTLVHFDPLREELQLRACGELGLKPDPKGLAHGYADADDFWSRENGRLAIADRPPAEQAAFYAEYERRVLRGGGLQVTPQVAGEVFQRLRQFKYGLAAFPDAQPALRELKGRGLTVGLISNIRRDLEGLFQELGLAPYLDFMVTSQEAGVEKPHPAIFQAALARAGVAPAQAIHVGDQYQSDVVGARAAGMQPLLLDRDGLWPEVKDCPVIHSLTEVAAYL
ncbi:MAG: HAD-IA family hydrolase [Chloroflexi bacterium]|nr:HAD-IA family hydrolase [Chloroflexota bacterium]